MDSMEERSVPKNRQNLDVDLHVKGRSSRHFFVSFVSHVCVNGKWDL